MFCLQFLLGALSVIRLLFDGLPSFLQFTDSLSLSLHTCVLGCIRMCVNLSIIMCMCLFLS